jgi:diguanylate cyclase (GGDEF)-like protein/PAS domain S-box-containing protein
VLRFAAQNKNDCRVIKGSFQAASPTRAHIIFGMDIRDVPGISPAPVTPPGSAAEATFAELFLQNPQPMFLYDKASLHFVEVNEAAVRRYGWTRDEFLAKTIFDIRPAEDVPRLVELIARGGNAPSPGFTHQRGWRHLCRGGEVIWVDLYSRDFEWNGGVVRLVIAQDITELHDAAESLREQSAFFSQLFHNSPEAIVLLDDHDCVVDANRAFQELFLYTADEARGRLINELVVPPELADEASGLSRTALEHHPIERDTVRMRRDGQRIEVSVLGYPITVDERQVGLFALYRDITQAKRIAAQLAYHSTHDVLTGLVNRHEFERRARERLERAPGVGAMLYFEVDQFKLINDGYGHEAGDHLLAELANVLRGHLRESDHLARLGGDEFGALMEDTQVAAAAVIADRVVKTVAEYRFRWRDRQHSVTVSAAVVPLQEGIADLTELMAAADATCHAAKLRGRNRVELYRSDDQDLARFRGELSWGARILEALDHENFSLYYQRIIPLGGTALRPHIEILLRVHDASGARMLPGVFVAAAERYGLMPAVDRYVIARVLKGVARRRVADPAFDDLICINLSGHTLSEEGFSTYIRDQFEATGAQPRQVCFEITETAAIRNIARALNFIQDVRALGCGVALDDFGSGMSSFSYLKSFNVDYLKIDGSFIRDMAHNPLDSATAEAINKVAQVKGLKTVAECVENEETLTRVRALGVDYAQGFHLHQPEPWDVE